MLLPQIKAGSQSRDMIEQFRGYNHNLRITDGEFYDEYNMSSDNYPVMSPRAKRGVYSANTTWGMISKDALCAVQTVDGETFLYVNGAKTALSLQATPKQMVSMGAYVVIFPDKKYYNTQDPTDYGSIDNTVTIDATANDIYYSYCDIDGNDLSVTVSSSTPNSPTNGMLWLDISNGAEMKKYTTATSEWIPIETTYIKIKAAGIAAGFNQYDGAKISGIAYTSSILDLDGNISSLYAVHHADPNDNSDVDYITVIGVMTTDTKHQITGTLVVSRTSPVMDFVVESNNRLWGCRYGLNNDNKVVNEIYASKLGDFKNWNCYMGISTDSYTASCGTDGAFTGAISYIGYPLFFKEDALHKVYGNMPANFQIQSFTCRGVMKGAGRSLAIVNERVYYKSRSGVCVYDGSLPSEVSYALGDIKYSGVDATMAASPSTALIAGAVGGADNNKYYISMCSEKDNTWYLFTYDTSLGLWHKEDTTRADGFTLNRGKMYYIDHADGKIKEMGSSTSTEKIHWMVESGELGLSLPNRKYITLVTLQISLEVGATASISVQYDTGGQWYHITTVHGSGLDSFTVPIKPRRCNHFKLKIEGNGDGKVYSISKVIEQGSNK